MVLLVDNTELASAPEDLAVFYSQFPALLQEARRMAARAPIKVDTAGVLYVRQKQWAATQPGEALDNGQVGRSLNLNCEYIIYDHQTTSVHLSAQLNKHVQILLFNLYFFPQLCKPSLKDTCHVMSNILSL